VTATLLSRHAECAFWLGRYLERAESMARILEAQASFQRGRPGEDGWAWIIALYSDQERFYKKFPEATAANVISFYVTWLDNPGSIQASVRAARENARALRPLISTDMWAQINDFYARILALGETDFSENRLTRSCDMIKRGCYAEIGVAENTLYRDESWPFFRLGQFIERADQTSRLLDVQFAQRATRGVPDKTSDQQASLWNALLRSASAYHSYRRAHPSGFDPNDIARFMIFDTRLPRSIAFCTGEIQRMVGKLRGEFRLRSAQRVYDHVERFQKDLQERGRNEKLLDELHCFNDWVQRELMELTAELGTGLFGHQAEKETETEAPEIPAPPKPGLGSSGQTQSQSSAQTQTQG
jgi:uncharacterized alpha-E superfamily protein